MVVMGEEESRGTHEQLREEKEDKENARGKMLTSCHCRARMQWHVSLALGCLRLLYEYVSVAVKEGEGKKGE